MRSSVIRIPVAVGGMREIILLRLALLITIAAGTAFSLAPNLLLSQYIHTSWTSANSFPLSNIEAIAQTSDGYIWLGTTTGLFQFDGVRVSRWQPSAGDALPSNQICALYASRDGSLWIGTSTGISRLKGGRLLNFAGQNGLPRAPAIAIIEDHVGRVWVSFVGPKPTMATIQNGAATIQPMPIAMFPVPAVLALYEDSRKVIWMGADHGLCHTSADEPISCRDTRSAILSLAEDTNGNLLASERSTDSIVTLAGTKFTPLPVSALAPRALMRDRDGNVWLGTLGEGLFRLRNGRAQRITRKDGLSSDVIRAIMEDREGDLWIGTTNGLDRFRDPEAPRITTLEGLSGDLVSAVYAAHNGDLFVGTSGAGLNLLHRRETTVARLGSRKTGSTIISLGEDASDRLWIGTTGGLLYGRSNGFVQVRSPEGAPLVRTFGIAADRDGGVWLVDERRGLLKGRNGRTYDPGVMRFQLGAKDIYQIHVDTHGALWIGYFHGGLTVFHGNVAKSYVAPEGLAPGPVYAIHSDEHGILWVGTGSGLSRLRNGRWTTWTQRDGVPEGGVQSIMDSKTGALWLTTAEGLMSVPMNTLNNTPDCSPRALKASLYGATEGIHMGATREMANPRITRSADGRLWIATQDGVAVIDPTHLNHNPLPPPVIIERLVVDGRTRKINNGAQPAFHGRELQIEYTALSLVAPERIKFKYKLDGYEERWRDGDNRRSVRYTNLRPAYYRFLVIACNNDGVWNYTGASVRFRVLPYFYQTWWFSSLCLIALAVGAWGLHVARQNTLRTQFKMVLKERGRLTRELHDTVLQGFAGVLYHLEAAWRQFDRAPEVSRQTLERALDLAEESLREARQTLSFTRLSAIENCSLVEAVATAGRKLVDGKPVRFATRVEGNTRQFRYDVQSNLYILAREAINNAVNHAGAREINLELIYWPERFQLIVRDDGNGFEPVAEADDEHFGLAAMRERAHQIGAVLKIESQHGHGTTVHVDLPMKWSPKQNLSGSPYHVGD